jgi:hypothetical protein
VSIANSNPRCLMFKLLKRVERTTVEVIAQIKVTIIVRCPSLDSKAASQLIKRFCEVIHEITCSLLYLFIDFDCIQPLDKRLDFVIGNMVSDIQNKNCEPLRNFHVKKLFYSIN